MTTSATHERIAGEDVDRLTIRADDPPAETGVVLIYIRPVDGTNHLCARFPSGVVTIIL